MPNLNRVMLMGHLGRDPEMRYLPSGDPVCSATMATTEKWKDKNGEKQERTTWHRLMVFGKRAEIFSQYTRKGDPVYVEGSLRGNEWVDKNGAKQYTLEVNVTDFQILKPRDQVQPERRAESRPRPTQRKDNDLDDDIPF